MRSEGDHVDNVVDNGEPIFMLIERNWNIVDKH